jgi:hypothetical protein
MRGRDETLPYGSLPPASGFRRTYPYASQKKDVFQDSRVRFLEMMGGAYWEVVYDNMKNVVRKASAPPRQHRDVVP